MFKTHLAASHKKSTSETCKAFKYSRRKSVWHFWKIMKKMNISGSSECNEIKKSYFEFRKDNTFKSEDTP